MDSKQIILDALKQGPANSNDLRKKVFDAHGKLAIERFFGDVFDLVYSKKAQIDHYGVISMVQA